MDNANQISLIVKADEPALFFTSFEAASQYLEWQDVQDGVYPVAFSPDGKQYSIWNDRNVVLFSPTNTKDEAALELILREFLTAIRVEIGESESIESLIEKCEPHVTA
jgi:hypothetical protein